MADQSTQPQQEGGKKIRIQYYRSAIGFPENQKQLVRSLGFTKLNQIVERPDSAAIRGGVQKVPHLLRIIE
jgi:large subunit ribosomal protein L30